MCKNEQKPELDLKLEPCYKKRKLWSRSHTHENEEICNWSYVMKRRALEPELYHFLQQLCSPNHDIDTIIQLYKIVGIGIKLKPMSVSSWTGTSCCLP